MTVGSVAQPVWPGRSFLDHSRLSRSVPSVPARSMLRVYGIWQSNSTEVLPIAPPRNLSTATRLASYSNRAFLLFEKAETSATSSWTSHRRASMAWQPAKSVALPPELSRMGPLPAAVPLADAVPVVHFGVEQIADRARGDKRLEIDDQRVPAEHEADDAAHAGLGHGVAQGPVLVHRDGDRLFDEDMFAGLGGGDALGGVDVVRPAEVHDVHPRIGQHGVEIVAGRAVELEPVDQPLGRLAAAAGDGDDFDVRIFQPTGGVGLGHVAHAVNGDAKKPVFHNQSPSR